MEPKLSQIQSKTTTTRKSITFTNGDETGNISKSPTHMYRALTRSDFDMSVVEKWLEIRGNNNPKRRCLHSSFVYKSYFYVHGGIDIRDGEIMDLYRISIENFINPEWELVKTSGAMPEKLSGTSGVLADDKFYLFGGVSSLQQPTNYLYILSLDDFKWEKRIFLEDEVPNLYSHTANYYSKTNTLVLFGGFIKGDYSNDLYLYSISKNEWTKLKYSESDCNLPCGRISHSSIIANDSLYIYAGQDSAGGVLSDMWKFDLIKRQWEEIEYRNTDIPCARSGQSAVYHLLSNSIYIFGGKSGSIQERNDLWKFDINKNIFTLIHDTLIEQYFSEDNVMTQSHDHVNVKKHKSIFLSKSSIKELQVNFTKNTINSRTHKKTIKDGFKEKMREDFEQMIFESSLSQNLAESMIYKSDVSDFNSLNQGANSNYVKNFFNFENLKNGSVPAPRDRHSSTIYENIMLLFGGDRNKYPYNDFFIFNLA